MQVLPYTNGWGAFPFVLCCVMFCSCAEESVRDTSTDTLRIRPIDSKSSASPQNDQWKDFDRVEGVQTVYYIAEGKADLTDSLTMIRLDSLACREIHGKTIDHLRSVNIVILKNTGRARRMKSVPQHSQQTWTEPMFSSDEKLITYVWFGGRFAYRLVGRGQIVDDRLLCWDGGYWEI